MAGRRRVRDSASDKVERGCAACCQKCRFSPYGVALCWASVALMIIVLILWIGGAFLVGPAENESEPNVCSSKPISFWIGSKDPYVEYTLSSGIIVTLTIFGTCCYCVSFVGLCFSGLPRVVRYLACVGLIIALLAFAVLVGWMAVGTYLASQMDKGGRVCANYAIYLGLFYLFLVGLIGCCIVSGVWKAHDLAKSSSGVRSKA